MQVRRGFAVCLGASAALACSTFGNAFSTAHSSPLAARAGTFELRSPLEHALLVKMATYRAPDLAEGDVGLMAYQYVSHVYLRPDSNPKTIGLVRRGTLLRGVKTAEGPGCAKGHWYALAQQGYACEGHGFMTATSADSAPHQLRPDLRKATPYRYGKVNSRNALRYFRMPSASEQREIDRTQSKSKVWPDPVAGRLDGDYFVAIDREEASGKRRYFRTVLGRYVSVADVDLKTPSDMHGELLNAQMRLPLAFVYSDDPAPLIQRNADKREPVGLAYKHARFHVEKTARWDERDVAVGQDGLAVERQYLRIAKRQPRPRGISAAQKWLHVDLDRQTLVAYEGDRAVFATLVSTGREGHDTPTGLFHIHEKHKTVTMRGSDASGVFEVSEVPWTMFYHRGYALHGAYWHDDFGKVRSHGCVNLSPVDARWLFQFTTGQLPQGWHAIRNLEGTAVYFTRAS